MQELCRGTGQSARQHWPSWNQLFLRDGLHLSAQIQCLALVRAPEWIWAVPEELERAVGNPVRAKHQPLPSSPHGPAGIPGFPESEGMHCCSAAFDSSSSGFVIFGGPWVPLMALVCSETQRKMHILLKVIDHFPGLEYQHWFPCEWAVKCPSTCWSLMEQSKMIQKCLPRLSWVGVVHK